jgi:muconolactone delta-isomerase
MNDIRKFPDSVEAENRCRQKAAYREEQCETSSAEDGRQAWDAIGEWRRQSQKNLDPNDRVAIAEKRLFVVCLR